MKISGTYSVGSRQPAGRKKQAGGGTRFSDSLETTGSQATSSPAAAGPANAISALLAIQEVPDASDGRSRGLMQARDLLDGLEDIRRGLLLGQIPVPQLKRLAATMRDRKESVTDPALSELIGDIELRAAVELAKLGIYL